MDIGGLRVAVLLDDEQNRIQLSRRLLGLGLLVSTDEFECEPSCQLCFVDAAALERLHERIAALQPIPVPCLLIGPKEHNAAVIDRHHGCIDQVLATPLSDAELKSHIAIALRVRRHVAGLRTQLAQAATAAHRAEERYRIVSQLTSEYAYGFRVAPGGVYVLEWTTQAFEQTSGYTLDEINRLGWRVLIHPDDIPAFRHRQQRLRAGRMDAREYRVVTKGGAIRWLLDRALPELADGKLVRVHGAAQDITERKRYEARLEYQATHDTLTRLPNRTLLQDRLQQAIAQAQRDSRTVTVLFIDLDHFKVVNDSVGHEAGDWVLRQAAERLRATVRECDTVARQGGDEFVIVAHHLDDEKQVAQFAQRILAVMTRPIPIGKQEFFATCSIGIGLYPRDGQSASELLKNADAAMYRAKRDGRNIFRFYAAEMNARAHLRFAMEAAMRRAIARREFVLHYQPQVELAGGRLTGFEALVRWQHPELGLLGPGQFIGLAEETGLIVQIGEWVLREACRQAKAWQEQGLGRYLVAVNLSARQFSDGNLTMLVDSALENAGLEPACLELEITESLLMENPDAAADTLRRLRGRGVRLSIDDFGTGYSSLGYLRRFALDKLKIDASFIHDISHDPDSAAIATAIIAMAHRLKLTVVAEGVETADQLAFLQAHRCDEVQGFLFSRALPAQDCSALLRTQSRFDLPPTAGDA